MSERSSRNSDADLQRTENRSKVRSLMGLQQPVGCAEVKCNLG